MSEPTVQVPVSLIKRIQKQYEGTPTRPGTMLGELVALLSQPTPTVEPPRIEDSAPVATHSSGEHRRVRLGEGDDLPVCDTCINVLGLNLRWDHAVQRHEREGIDPSTIRDVRPPEVTP